MPAPSRSLSTPTGCAQTGPTDTHTGSSQQTSHRYRLKELSSQSCPPPPPTHLMRNSLCKPQRHWMNVSKEKVLARICRAGAHQYNIICTHIRAFETSAHGALGCNLSFFLEVLCRSRGITMTPISSHTHTHTHSRCPQWESWQQKGKSSVTYIN